MRLYQDGEWFDALPPGALYEHEYEGIVMQHRNDLFPGFKGARFDPVLATQLGNVQPDMILIDHEYRSMFVVEVELASHSLTRHVQPQIEKIVSARLGERHADWLYSREPGFNQDRLRALFRDVPHSTVLLANGPTPHWDDGLRSLPGVYRAVVQVFRSARNRTILRVNGAQPEGPGEVVSVLSAGSGPLRTSYKVSVPSSVDASLEKLDAHLEDQLIRFHVRVMGAEKYLFSRPAINVPAGGALLLRSAGGSYRIEIIG
ncbi:hypothetical protein [Micromonospora cremea]|uniref:DUF4263 domain-containing protein n=1 Tax=Micromonospora cremea TaxID=709881 RepID=A0A1N6ANA4_9ACTN|nr:hypothetical protein [Micromonospora cremea]SIN35496.1 hypothetical protein SAMN04489832_5815 [Micromonospora cremea]